jgi:hypothetical protein
MHHRYLPQGTVGALSVAIPPLALKPINDQENHTNSALLVRVQLASVNADGRVAVQLATALRMSEIDAHVATTRRVEAGRSATNENINAHPGRATVVGRPPGTRVKKKKTPMPSFLPDYELTTELWDASHEHATPAFMMLAGPTVADGASGDDPDLLRIATVMNESDLPSADLILMMPSGVSYDEYINYSMSLTSDQIAELVDEGSDTVHGSVMFAGDVPFAVHIILENASVNDMTVDDVFNITPDDSTPVDFARACALMGASMRAYILARFG